jgi:hypothetical protein
MSIQDATQQTELEYILQIIGAIKYSKEDILKSWLHGDILFLFDILARNKLTIDFVFLARYLCETKRNYILGYAVELHRTKQTKKHKYSYAYLDEPIFSVLKNTYEGNKAF